MRDENDPVALVHEIHANVRQMKGAFDARLTELEQRAVPGANLMRGSLPGASGGAAAVAKAMLASPEFQALLARRAGSAGITVKLADLLNVRAGTIISDDDTNPAQRIPGVVGNPVQRIFLRQLLRNVPASAGSFTFTRETSSAANWTAESQHDSSSPVVVEGVAKKESAIGFESVTMPISTIAHFLKISTQVASDNEALTQFVQTRMRQGCELAVEDDIINGTGGAGDMWGILRSGNYTAFTPTTGDTQVDSLRRAKLALEAADFQSSLFILNPADVAKIELQKDAEERFLVGRPVVGGLPQLWGTNIYGTTKLAAGKFIALDLMALEFHAREEVNVRMFEQDEDNVQKNLLTIRAEVRGGLGVSLPAGIRYGNLTL